VLLAPVSGQIPCKQGVFQGNFRFRGLGNTLLKQKHAAAQHFLGEFPTLINSEISCTNKVGAIDQGISEAFTVVSRSGRSRQDIAKRFEGS